MDDLDETALLVLHEAVTKGGAWVVVGRVEQQLTERGLTSRTGKDYVEGSKTWYWHEPTEKARALKEGLEVWHANYQQIKREEAVQAFEEWFKKAYDDTSQVLPTSIQVDGNGDTLTFTYKANAE